MRVEVYDKDEGLTGEREAWVKVLSNEVVDLHDALGALDAEQRELLEDFTVWDGARKNTTPYRYYPHIVTAEEQAEHGHAFEEWWIFLEKSTAKNRREREEATA